MKTPEEIKAIKLALTDIETTCGHCPYCGEPNGCNRPDGICKMFDVALDAAEAISQLEAQQPRWISVGERLPEEDQEVLLIAHGWEPQSMYIGHLHHVEAETSWLTGITSKESEWSISGWSYLRAPEVTHWMPLPQSPEEERK